MQESVLDISDWQIDRFIMRGVDLVIRPRVSLFDKIILEIFRWDIMNDTDPIDAGIFGLDPQGLCKLAPVLVGDVPTMRLDRGNYPPKLVLIFLHTLGGKLQDLLRR